MSRLADENEQLNELYGENQRLKSLFQLMQKEVIKFNNENNELKKENEQLKQQVRYLKVVCRNELDDEILKQVMGSLGGICE